VPHLVGIEGEHNVGSQRDREAHCRKMPLAPRLPGALYLKLQKIKFQRFKKIKIKYLGVAKCIYYNFANF
jgi:hypothetical protein